MHEGNLLFDF